MARYVDAIDLDLPLVEAFDYLADFASTVEWDPSVVQATPLQAGPPRVGSRFRLVVSLLGRRIPLTYRIEVFEPPQRLVLVSDDGPVHSRDELTFTARGSGTRVAYEARLEASGPARLADPALQLMLEILGRIAVRGLRERTRGMAAERAAS